MNALIRNMPKTALTYTASLALGLLWTAVVQAQAVPAMAGHWVINEDLSDNTDKQVATALRKAGDKVSRCWLNCKEDRFRGGPAEQELYDRISYDDILAITLEEPVYRFTYADNFSRDIYTDGRSRSVSLTGLSEVKDFSMAHWEGNKLMVEARPRDGGFATEVYTLEPDGNRLRVELHIEPRAFSEPIDILRIYDRASPAPGL